MSKLILVRHSTAAVAPGNPPSTWPLSKAGRRRCLSLAGELRQFAPAAIFASYEAKAVETARILSDSLGIGYQVVAGLQEHKRTSCDFMDTRQELVARLRQFFAEPQSLVFGRETADQARRRFSRAISGLVETRRGETLAAVSHGTVISLFVAASCGLDPFLFWRRLDQPSYAVLSLPEFNLLSLTPSVGAADSEEEA